MRFLQGYIFHATHIGAAAPLHQHQHGRAQCQLQRFHCQSKLREIFGLPFVFCFVNSFAIFVLFFASPAWQPIRPRVQCQPIQWPASNGCQPASTNFQHGLSFAPHGIKSTTNGLHHSSWVFCIAPYACNDQCFGSCKCLSTPLDPHPFTKPLPTQCELLFLFCFFFFNQQIGAKKYGPYFSQLLQYRQCHGSSMLAID